MIILGGYDENVEFGDGWVFNTRTDTLRKVIEPSENSLKFYSDDNQSYMICENSMIAQV